MPTKRKEKYADSTSPANAVCSGKLAGDNNNRVDNNVVVAIDNDNDTTTKKSKNIVQKKKPGVATTQAAESTLYKVQKKKRTRTSKKSTATTTNDQMMGDNTSTIKVCTTKNDDITKVKTAKHCAKQWESLFQMRDSKKTTLKNTLSTANTTSISDIHTNNNCAQDVFNCEELIIPPSHELVNNEVDIGIQRWKDLAARVIIEEDGPTICKNEENGRSIFFIL